MTSIYVSSVSIVLILDESHDTHPIPHEEGAQRAAAEKGAFDMSAEQPETASRTQQQQEQGRHCGCVLAYGIRIRCCEEHWRLRGQIIPTTGRFCSDFNQ